MNNLPALAQVNPHLGFGEGTPIKCTPAQKWHTVGMLLLMAKVVLVVGAIIGVAIAAPVAIGVAAAIILAYGAAAGGGLGFLGLTAFAIFSYCNLFKASEIESAQKMLPKSQLGVFEKNTILPTEHGVESWEWKLEMLRNTQQSCEVSGNFVGGPLFVQFLEEVEHIFKAKPHVKVHIIGSSECLEKTDRPVIERLQKAWPNNFFFLETSLMFEYCPTLRSIENHVKLFVVDGRHFIIGGTGLQKELGATKGEVATPKENRPFWKDLFTGREYRDMDFVGEGPTAQASRIEFFKLWNMWSQLTKQVIPNSGYFDIDLKAARQASAAWEKAKSNGRAILDVDTKLLISDACKPNAIFAEHHAIIRSATTDITCGNLNLNNMNIVDSFNHAASKGVAIEYVTNGVHEDSPPNHAAFVPLNYAHYLPFLMGRKIKKLDPLETLEIERKARNIAARVHKYTVGGVMYHRKATTADAGTKDGVVIAGSANYSMKSEGIPGRGGDCEISITMRSPELSKRVKQMILGDIGRSKEITLKEAYELYQSIFAKATSFLVTSFIG